MRFGNTEEEGYTQSRNSPLGREKMYNILNETTHVLNTSTILKSHEEK